MKFKLLVLFLLLAVSGFAIPDSTINVTKKVEADISMYKQMSALKPVIDNNISQILSSINTNFQIGSNAIPPLDAISEGASESLNMIWKFTKFYCTEAMVKEDLLTNSIGYQVRNIPVNTEDGVGYHIVIQMDSKGIATDVYFAVAQHQYKEIMDATDILDITRREIILNFIENFRTGYVRKDLPYLKDVFSDDALFITGKFVEKVNMESKDNPFNKSIVSINENKTEYLAGLEKVFKANKSIKIEFDSIIVIRHKRYPEFYGVRLIQHWVSDKEKNDGNLFLLIQFREESDPIIWVRSWQDIRIQEDDLIGLHSFIIK